jgi:hypothetical protein
LCPGVISPLGSVTCWLHSPAALQLLKIADGSIFGWFRSGIKQVVVLIHDLKGTAKAYMHLHDG